MTNKVYVTPKNAVEAVKQNIKWRNLAQKCLEIQQERKRLQVEEAELLNMLKEISEGKQSYYGDIVFYNITRKGSVDYKNIPEIKQIDLDQYRKPDVTSWKLVQI